MFKAIERLELSITQLLLLCGVATLLPALLVGVYAVTYLVARDHEHQRENLKETAVALAFAVERELDALGRKAALLASARTLTSGDGRQAPLLTDVATRTGHAFLLFDRSHRRIAGDAEGLNAAPAGLADVFMRGVPRISQMAGPEGEAPTLVLLTPLVVEGDVTEVLVLVPKRFHFQQVLAAVPLPRGWLAAIDDPNNVIVARSEDSSEFVGRRARLQTPEGGAGVLDFTGLDGRKSVFAYAVSSATGFRGTVWAPHDIFYEGASRLIRWLTGLAIAVLLLSLAGAIAAAALVRRPIKRLAETAGDLQRGDAVQRPPMLMREANIAESAMVAAARALAEREHDLRRETEKTGFLVRELAHRLKNLLAVIMAILRQSLRTTSDLHVFRTQFESRLASLARSVDLLVQSDWEGVSLSSLIEHQLEPFDMARRVTLSGPDVLLSTKATEQLGMALHELATNAAKHGALSTGEGRIAIEWRVEGGAFDFVWRETGGPTATAPDRAGFGRTVIERAVPATLMGESQLKFEPAGFEWHLRAPRAEVLMLTPEAEAKVID